jgi:hypothetical protein
VVQKVSNGGGAPGAWPPRGHLIEHVVRDRVAKVERDLGQIQTDFGHGPKTKVGAHMKLYIFH